MFLHTHINFPLLSSFPFFPLPPPRLSARFTSDSRPPLESGSGPWAPVCSTGESPATDPGARKEEEKSNVFFSPHREEERSFRSAVSFLRSLLDRISPAAGGGRGGFDGSRFRCLRLRRPSESTDFDSTPLRSQSRRQGLGGEGKREVGPAPLLLHDDHPRAKADKEREDERTQSRKFGAREERVGWARGGGEAVRKVFPTYFPLESASPPPAWPPVMLPAGLGRRNVKGARKQGGRPLAAEGQSSLSSSSLR